MGRALVFCADPGAVSHLGHRGRFTDIPHHQKQPGIRELSLPGPADAGLYALVPPVVQGNSGSHLSKRGEAEYCGADSGELSKNAHELRAGQKE